MARNPGSYGSFVQSAHCWSLYGRHQGPCLHCLLLDTDESSENLAIDSVLPIIVGQTAQTESRYFLAGCAALSSFVRFLFLPKTAHRSLPHEKLREERGNRFVFYGSIRYQSLGYFGGRTSVLS